MKLSPRQVEVLRLMAEGWTMTPLGLEKDGKKRPVHDSTFWAVWRRRLIAQAPPSTNYVLTEAGRQEAERIWKVKP